MRIRLLLPMMLLLAACSTQETTVSPTPSAEPAPAETTVEHQQAAIPFDSMPIIADTDERACPYLDTQWVADTNGQRVTRTGIDERFDPPACVYWSYQEDPQLTVLVRHMPDEEQATAVVDWAAPVDTTNPAKEPEGWEGGRFGGDGHSVYAVSKGTTAIVVFSNQEQSVKPELVAKEVINNLGL